MSFIAAFIAVVVLIPFASVLAKKVGLVDEPGGRKQHDAAVPLIGGLVVFLSYMIVLIVSGGEFFSFLPMFSALSIVLVLGVVDDRFHVRAWIKFMAQLLAALILVFWGDVRIYHLGDIFGFGQFELGFMSILFTLASIMLLINAINLIDGLDGLAGGVLFVIFLWLIVACLNEGDMPALRVLAPLAAALAGFLVYNLRTPFRKKASVFLGDAGSMALGLTIAWLVIVLSQKSGAPVQPISVAWILALPIIDECAQFYRRVRAGRHPFSPDRKHFHHHFIGAGFSTGQATAFILCLSFAFGGIGYGLVFAGIPEFVLTFCWIFLLFFHMFWAEKPQRYVAGLKALKGQFF